MKKIKKIITILSILIILITSFNNFVYGSIIVNEAYMYKVADCTTKLRYFSLKQNRWLDVICYYTEYNDGINKYPAYCLDADFDGAGERGGYTVDVTQVLENEEIWRVIKNGYPYKDPSALGVSTVLDAYMVTKRAVHSILYDVYDIHARYEAFDAHGEHILDCIQALVDIGRYGTETRDNTHLTIDKEGNLYKDGEFYTQKFNVSSHWETSQYTITATANLPANTIICNANGDQTNTFRNTESFYVKIPKESLTVNANPTIAIQAKSKTYPVFYGATRIPNTQNYALTCDPYTDETGRVTFDIDVFNSSLKIIKIDEDTQNPIKNVEFNFRYEDGQNIGNYKTSANGTITLNNLRPGTVIATEISTASEYILNTDETKIVLGYNDSKTVTIENEHKRGNLKVYKVDADNNRVNIGGVKFALYSYEFGRVIGYYTTDVNGEIYIEGLRTGKWALIETETNKWYNLLENQVDIKIEWNDTTNTTIENELKKSQIKVIKVDQENNEVKLENVEFEVLDKDGNVLEKIKTNAEGEAYTSRYAIRDYSELYIKETITNEKYVLDDTVHKIELKENQIVTQKFENKKIKGQIQIVKTSAEDNKITDEKAGDPIANVSFDIYDEDKNYIETIITNEEGIAITSLLEKGIKYIKEKESAEWYLLNTEEYSGEIINDGDIIVVEISNIPENPDVDIEKTGIIQTTANEEIKYNFKIKNTGNVKLDKFTWYDYLPTDYIRATKLVTGTYNQDLNYSIYYKTNKNDYRLLRDNLNTQINNYIDFTNLQLEDDEFVTEFKTDFGTVDVGFESIIDPYLFVKVNNDVKNDDVFTNETRIEGYNHTYLIWDEDNHTTEIYEKEITTKKLPRTRMLIKREVYNNDKK